MRRIKIGSAKALVLVWISLAVCCGSAAPASAQTYDFSFTGSGVTIMNGILVLSGQYVISASGTLSGVSSSADDGTFQLDSSFNSLYYNTSNNYHLEFDVITTPGGGVDTVDLLSGVNASVVEAGGNPYNGTSVVTSTPAPIPGSGPLSYLALGLGGLFINRKRLWRAARMAAGLAG